MSQYLLLKGLVFGVVMAVFYYFVTYRARDDRLPAAIRAGAVVGVAYIVVLGLLDWFRT